VVGVGVVVAAYLRVLERSFDGGLMNLVKVVMVGGVYGLMMLYLERRFLYDCYLMLRPSSPQAGKAKNETKKEL